jgi:acyl-CoA synthetase (AMP-forming)/AMP-acid ligase II
MSEAAVNIAAALKTRALERPDATAVVVPHAKGGPVSLSYADLDHESDRIARGLRAIGITRGTRTALMVPPGIDLFPLVFGVFKAGVVPVMIDPGIGPKHLKRCLAEAKPEAFIGIPLAHAARVILGWGRGSVKTVVTAGRRLFWGGYTLEQVKRKGDGVDWNALAETRADDVAAILFTSGSTGPPKGVVYTHGAFTAQVELIREMYDIRPGEVDLPTFPLFALFDPALGMTTVVPDMDPTRPAQADPKKILGAIQRYEVTCMFGSPALLDTVGRYGAEEGVKLPSLKRVISAGAPVPPHVMRTFCRMLEDDASIVTPYGATEVLPVASVSSHEVLDGTEHLTARGAGVCVGTIVPPNIVRIIPIQEEPIERWDESQCLPAGEIGEIVVKGPTVTSRYDGREEATLHAKIADGDAIRHRMGDLGYFDEEGRLWFCGRKAHRVKTAYGTLFTVPIEQVFNVHEDVKRSALVGVGTGEVREPALVVELTADGKRRPKDEILGELRALSSACPKTTMVKRFLLHPGLPVDIRHNAKINRPLLSQWATKESA